MNRRNTNTLPKITEIKNMIKILIYHIMLPYMNNSIKYSSFNCLLFQIVDRPYPVPVRAPTPEPEIVEVPIQMPPQIIREPPEVNYLPYLLWTWSLLNKSVVSSLTSLT